MRDALKKTRLLYVVLMGCLLLYIHAMNLISVPSYKSLNPMMYLALIFLGVNTLGVGQVMRHISRRTTVEKLRTNPDDPKAMRLWRSGLVSSGLSAEVLPIFGFLIYISGGTSRQVAPFFIAGAVALIIWWPKKP
jgi:hypothetical protein